MSKNEIAEFDENIIRDRIYSIRGFQVMLDRDLAELYGVETKVLNQAVKRNKERFPESFCFQILLKEYEILLFSSDNKEKESLISRSQIVTSILAKRNLGAMKKGGRTYLPYAFTEQGVAMLAGVLKSEIAVSISIKIIETFVAMRKFIQNNAEVFMRLNNLEIRQIETNFKLIDNEQKFEKVFSLLESKDTLPIQGIFYENQVFDAYKFVSDLFRSAKESILIIDNFIDDSVLVHLTKVTKGVKVKILNKSVSDQLALDVKKFNSQYFPIEIIAFTHAHDRFIIIDNKDVYHLGASLKDLGKKWFAFSKIDKSDMELLGKLEKY
ncbi:TPA: DNA-binding protein [Candidatus Delongbacteria bacterium]|nr:DNA-binding protein [Candidatus Delongbacteria bacterium]